MSNLLYKLLKYNGTCDRLKIEWRDQSYMKLEVVGIGQQKMNLIDEKRDCISGFLKCELIFCVFFEILNSPAYATSFPGLFPSGGDGREKTLASAGHVIKHKYFAGH